MQPLLEDVRKKLEAVADPSHRATTRVPRSRSWKRSRSVQARDPEQLVFDLDWICGFDRPTLLTTGDQSPPFFGPVVRKIAGSLPQAKVVTIPGAGHVPHVTHPAAYVAEVETFIRGAQEAVHPAGRPVRCAVQEKERWVRPQGGECDAEFVRRAVRTIANWGD